MHVVAHFAQAGPVEVGAQLVLVSPFVGHTPHGGFGGACEVGGHEDVGHVILGRGSEAGLVHEVVVVHVEEGAVGWHVVVFFQTDETVGPEDDRVVDVDEAAVFALGVFEQRLHLEGQVHAVAHEVDDGVGRVLEHRLHLVVGEFIRHVSLHFAVDQVHADGRVLLRRVAHVGDIGHAAGVVGVRDDIDAVFQGVVVVFGIVFLGHGPAADGELGLGSGRDAVHDDGVLARSEHHAGDAFKDVVGAAGDKVSLNQRRVVAAGVVAHAVVGAVVAVEYLLGKVGHERVADVVDVFLGHLRFQRGEQLVGKDAVVARLGDAAAEGHLAALEVFGVAALIAVPCFKLDGFHVVQAVFAQWQVYADA